MRGETPLKTEALLPFYNQLKKTSEVFSAAFYEVFVRKKKETALSSGKVWLGKTVVL